MLFHEEIRQKAKEAALNARKLIDWHQNQKEAESEEVVLLKRIHRLAKKKSGDSSKQT